jgi:hypothetical protein
MTDEREPGYRHAGSVPTTTITLRSFQVGRLVVLLFGSGLLVTLLALVAPSLGFHETLWMEAMIPTTLLVPAVWLVLTKMRPVRRQGTYLFRITDTDLWLETPEGIEVARFSNDTLHTACANYPMRGRATTYARPGVRLLFHGKDLLIGCMTPRDGWHSVPMVDRIPTFNVTAAEIDFVKGRL